jgi:hypothetical protein
VNIDYLVIIVSQLVTHESNEKIQELFAIYGLCYLFFFVLWSIIQSMILLLSFCSLCYNQGEQLESYDPHMWVPKMVTFYYTNEKVVNNGLGDYCLRYVYLFAFFLISFMVSLLLLWVLFLLFSLFFLLFFSNSTLFSLNYSTLIFHRRCRESLYMNLLF